MTTSKTADEIRGVMDALKLEVIASYFDQDDDEIDPYVVCEGVSVTAFNKYVGDGEGLRIPLRFLALHDGRLVIVELPTEVHESTARNFESKFLRAAGNEDEVAQKGSMTASDSLTEEVRCFVNDDPKMLLTDMFKYIGSVSVKIQQYNVNKYKSLLQKIINAHGLTGMEIPGVNLVLVLVSKGLIMGN
ncbi:unnamed protein product [Phytophthora lilii]|uniref:Unnamed protein product n=1 Tax=Phytophthora lilii TaxID=2077276 RepID=A0A9W6TTC2_9STRA|nr:unnamed protein product [Phytophthora lilii]